MINETLMTLGRWELRFRDSASREQQRLATYWDQICITPTKLPDEGLTRSAILTRSRFTGRIDDVDYDEPRTIGGPSALVWAGDHEGKGSFQHGGSGGPVSQSLQDWINGIYADATYVNGLGGPSSDVTVGATVSDDPIEDQITNTQPFRAFLESGRGQTDPATEYNLDPDGTLRLGAYDSQEIWYKTPRLMLTPDGGGYDGTLYAAKADISYRSSIQHYATDVVCVGEVPEGGGEIDRAVGIATQFISPRPKGFDGVTDAYVQAAIQISSTADADCEAQAANALLYEFTREWDFKRVTAELPDPKRWVRPGDKVYIFDPAQDLYGPNWGVGFIQVDYRGKPCFPLLFRVQGMKWSVVAGMGVYLLKNDASDGHYDISDWIQPETNPTEFVIETKPKRLQTSAPPAPPHLEDVGPTGGGPTYEWFMADAGWTLTSSVDTAQLGPWTAWPSPNSFDYTIAGGGDDRIILNEAGIYIMSAQVKIEVHPDEQVGSDKRFGLSSAVGFSGEELNFSFPQYDWESSNLQAWISTGDWWFEESAGAAVRLFADMTNAGEDLEILEARIILTKISGPSS